MTTSNVKPFPKKEVPESLIKSVLAESTRSKDNHEAQVKAAYHSYVENGWSPVLLRQGRKRPVEDGWESKTADENGFTGFSNIGVRFGPASNNLIDLDLDKPEVLANAKYFLPSTAAKFGRYYGTEEQHLGHWLYLCEIDEKIVFKDPSGAVALEIRGSHKCQTMFPPSYVYDPDISGLDLVCWEGGTKAKIPKMRDITSVSLDEIKARSRLLMASIYSAKYFVPGSFHSDMLSWIGFLCKCGFSKDHTELSVRWLVHATNQDGLEDRLASLEDTYRRHANGETLMGISTFKDNGWDDKFLTWLKNLLNPKKSLDSDGRPVVKVVEAKETELLDHTLEAMVVSKKFYHTSGEVCLIHKDKSRGLMVTPIKDTAAAISWLSREIMFTKTSLDKTTGQYTDSVIKAPVSLAQEIANIHTFRGDIPHLKGVSAVPTITPAGRIIEDTWGYDPELELFFACTYPVRKSFPDEAVKLLCEPFIDFPFVGGVGERSDKSPTGVKMGRYAAAAMSAVLAAILRPILDICPMYAVTSSQWQDGKSVLCNLIAAIVGMPEGSANSPLTRGGSDEEQEKQLSSVLSKGKRVVIFDNHDDDFRSPALTEVLTSTNPEFRTLGKNEVRSIPNKSMIMSNGVNMVLAGDLQTRTVMIRMSRDSTDPLRKFKHEDVVTWASNNQIDIVGAAISLIEWAMQQDNGNWKPTHRFKMWDKMVRRTIMLACGIDISPPAIEDDDRVVDPVEEVKRNLQLWFVDMINSGVRSNKSKSYQFVQARDLSERIAPDSEEEGWVHIVSKRPKQQLSYQVGICLRALENVPFNVPGDDEHVYKVEKAIHSGSVVYRLAKIKRT